MLQGGEKSWGKLSESNLGKFEWSTLQRGQFKKAEWDKIESKRSKISWRDHWKEFELKFFRNMLQLQLTKLIWCHNLHWLWPDRYWQKTRQRQGVSWARRRNFSKEQEKEEKMICLKTKHLYEIFKSDHQNKKFVKYIHRK